MTHENIVVNRPEHYEACRTCSLMDKVVKKVENEVLNVIKEDPNTTGATVTITCIDSNYAKAKVSPNVQIKFDIKNGFHERFSRDRVIICPEIIVSRKKLSKAS